MEKTHIVGRFDKDLQKNKDRILAMGARVAAQLKRAGELLEDFDDDAADALIAADRQINGMHKDIHAHAERLIALRQPMALDLRQALSPINIAGELERIGDHAKSATKRARKLHDAQPSEKVLVLIRDMGAVVQEMLHGALEAYQAEDIEMAAHIRMRDLSVDELNRNVMAAALAAIKDDPATAEKNVHLIILARGIERVGDHVVNITRHVHQIVTGEDLKASE